ncbi:MAG: beta-ketoacyl-ACP reductase, partial [Gammaproteobacteria bacterium]
SAASADWGRGSVRHVRREECASMRGEVTTKSSLPKAGAGSSGSPPVHQADRAWSMATARASCHTRAMVQTDMTDVLKEEIKEEYKKRIPLGRFGTPQEVARVVLFLASPLADYITGEVIHVNGGMY